MTWLSLLFLIILIIPTMLLSSYFHLKINKKIVYAIFRMVIQLSLIGLVLQYFFTLNNTWVNLAYALFMMTVASYSILNATNLSPKLFGASVWLALVVPHLAVLIFFNTFILQLDHIFDARYVITICGMLLGNSLSGNILAIHTFYDQLTTQKKKYHYTLSLSANRSESLRPFSLAALKSSIYPTLASIETIGLVALPGMMTGQILGGSIPITAIKYQIAIMIAIFVTRYFTAIFSIYLTSKKAFDDYDCLRADIFKG